MSIKPEPSVVGAGAAPSDAVDIGFALGIASDCRFESENSTEFSWRWPGRLSTRPPSWPAIDATLAPPPPPPQPGPRESPDAGQCAPAPPKRSPPPPAGAPAARG